MNINRKKDLAKATTFSMYPKIYKKLKKVSKKLDCSMSRVIEYLVEKNYNDLMK